MSRADPKPWTKAELDVIRDCARMTRTSENSDDWRHEAARRLEGRTYYAIKRIARDRGISTRNDYGDGVRFVRRAWSEDEEAVMRDHARRSNPNRPARDWMLAAARALPGRTVSSVKARANMMKISSRTPDGQLSREDASAARAKSDRERGASPRSSWKAWTWIEESIIKTAARRSRKPDGTLSKGWLKSAAKMLPNRTYGAVSLRALRLGLPTYGVTPAHSALEPTDVSTPVSGRFGEPWSADDDAMLRDLSTAHGKRWLHIAIDLLKDYRTPRAVRERGRHLGLPYGTLSIGAWTPEEDKRLTDAARQPDLPKDWVRVLAETIPHRTFQSVKNRVNRLGLVQLRKHQEGFVLEKPTPEDDAAPTKRERPWGRKFVINPQARADRVRARGTSDPIPPTPVECDIETVDDAEIRTMFAEMAQRRAQETARSRAAMREAAIKYGDLEYLDTDDEVLYGQAA